MSYLVFCKESSLCQKLCDKTIIHNTNIALLKVDDEGEGGRTGMQQMFLQSTVSLAPTGHPLVGLVSQEHRAYANSRLDFLGAHSQLTPATMLSAGLPVEVGSERRRGKVTRTLP